MSKKINLSNISNVALKELSNYNVAIKELLRLRNEYTDNKEKFEAEKQGIIDARTLAFEEKKLSTDEIIEQFSLVEIDAKIASLSETYKNDCKPHKSALTQAYKYVDDTMYTGYTTAMQSGNLSDMSKEVAVFLHKIGILDTPEAATEKMCKILALQCSGMRKATGKNADEGHYAVTKQSRTFKDMFLRVFLEYCVVEKGVFDQNDDYTLVRHDFTKDNN